MINTLSYLTDLKSELCYSGNWIEIILTHQWTLNIPSKAGVYVLKEGNEIVYVGETGNLRKRMKDLLDSRHHTVRRTIGGKLYSNHKGFAQATTKVKFPNKFEDLLNRHISDHLKIAYLTVELGRKELEEFIEKDIKPEFKLNKRGKRKS